MPPPQCPECGRFLATAFVETIKTEPAPCPRCGTELSLAEEDDLPADAPGDAPDEVIEDAPADEVVEDAPADEVIEDAPPEEPVEQDVPASGAAARPPATGSVLDDVEPEPESSVRPPDLAPERDPLEGWDESGTVTVGGHDEPDPAVLAAGAGIGLLVGLLLGGKDHRGLGALLGAALGAVVARIRG